jgi:hypothetical protein
VDWQLFVQFLAAFSGVFLAFVLEWAWRRQQRKNDRKQFLKGIRHELETGSTFLTGEARTMPVDMWESGKASGSLSLVSYEQKTKLASIYYGIGSHNYESIRLRDVSILAATTTEKPKVESVVQVVQIGDKKAMFHRDLTDVQRLHMALNERNRNEEKALKAAIQNLLKENMWK